MWNEPIKLSSKDVPRHLRGNYAGRKFNLKPASEVIIPADANTWGGGSKENWYAIRLADGAAVTLGSTDAPWSEGRKDKTVILSPGIAVVVRSIFCGKDMGLTFYVHADNLPKFIKNG
jgi:hypothetical protein